MIFTEPLKIWSWQPEMLLVFAREKAAQLLTSDAPSGPQSILQKQPFLLALHRWAGSFARRNYSSRNVLSGKRPRRNVCFCRLVRKVDLNLFVLQRGNLLMLHAELPLVLTVPSWVLDFLRQIVWIWGIWDFLSILRCSAEDVRHLPLVLFIYWFK